MQAADAIPLAAQNEGGLAGLGAGLGVGLGTGQMVGQAMAQALQTGATPPVATPAAPAAPAAPVATGGAAAPISADEVAATLEKLHGLMTKGILTQDEFNAKKAELLGRLA